MISWYITGGIIGGAAGILCKCLVGADRQDLWIWQIKKETLLIYNHLDIAVVLVSVITSLYEIWLYGTDYVSYIDFCLLMYLLLPVAVIDAEELMISDKHLLCWFILVFMVKLWNWNWQSMVQSISGMAAGAAILGVTHLTKNSSVGIGDIKLLGICGLIVGVSGVLHLLANGLIMGVIFSIIQLLRRKITIKTEIPFVPFLFLGAWL